MGGLDNGSLTGGLSFALNITGRRLDIALLFVRRHAP